MKRSGLLSRAAVPLLGGALALLAATPANACTLCSCTTSTASISFGSYNSLAGSPTDATALVSIDCTGVVSLFGLVEVRAGAGLSGDQLQRTLVRGASTLNYNLYANSARTQILGDGTDGTTTLTTPLNGLLLFNTSVPVYARIPAGQWVSAGTYGDTVVITVQY